MIKRDIHDLPLEGLDWLADDDLLYAVHEEECFFNGLSSISQTNPIGVFLAQIPQYNVRHNGGIIVAAKGDISLVLNTMKPILKMKQMVCDFLVEKLRQAYHLNAQVDNNDIVVAVNGNTLYKVIATAWTTITSADRNRLLVHININQPNLQHINNISIRQIKNKIPAGLSQWGITTADVESSWLGELQELISEGNLNGNKKNI